MNVFDGLKLLRLVADGEVKTYLAADPPRARNVLVHWMPLAANSEIQAMLELLDTLPQTGRSLILEAGIRAGKMYVITDISCGLNGLQEWLVTMTHRDTPEATDPVKPVEQGPLRVSSIDSDPAQLSGVSPQPEDTPAVHYSSPPENAPVAGEFTKLFSSSAVPVVSRPVHQPAEGEFTRLFTRSDLGSGTRRPPEPGEFTRIFLQGSASLSAKPTSVSGRDAPGEFTVLFQDLDTPQTLQQRSQSNELKPGEFTNFLNSPLAAAAAAVGDNRPPMSELSASARPPSGDFTLLFGKSGGPFEPPQPKEATGVFSTAPTSLSAEGSSEFSGIFAVSREAAKPQPSSLPGPEPSPSAPAKSVLPLIVILGSVAVLALVMVFLFVRK